jgi:hypothetical protein
MQALHQSTSMCEKFMCTAKGERFVPFHLTINIRIFTRSLSPFDAAPMQRDEREVQNWFDGNDIVLEQ